MEKDVPLTNLFECPYCGFRALLKAELVARVRCICGGRWIKGNQEHYLSLTLEEREKVQIWDINLYRDQRELNDTRFSNVVFWS